MRLFTEKRTSFPDPHSPLYEGVLDMSDDLSVERLLEAYSFGIFPWPHEDLPVLWFSPDQRGVIEFSKFHVPASLEKHMRRVGWRYSFDEAFDQVIEQCARQPRPGQSGTWINSNILQAYKDFHRAGYAHSLEVWEGEELVGGIYGVYVGGLFCGESMFFKKDNASKAALVKLVEFLRGQELEWMDIQMVTPVLENFGGHYISRDEFLWRLEKAKQNAFPVDFKI